MEQPTYLRRLLNQKVLLIIGFVVAVAAGLLAGFTVEDGQIEPRADRSYMASSTVLLTSPQPDYFQVEIPGETTALPQSDDPEAQEVVVQDPTPINLSDSAIILAYMASSDEVAAEVAARTGDFEDGEGISAVRRTTQPAGDEQFGGRLTLRSSTSSASPPRPSGRRRSPPWRPPSSARWSSPSRRSGAWPKTSG